MMPKCKKCERRQVFRAGAILCWTCAKEVARRGDLTPSRTVNHYGSEQSGRKPQAKEKGER